MAVSTNKNVKPNLNNADLSFFDVCLNKYSRLWMLTPRDSIDLTDVTTPQNPPEFKMVCILFHFFYLLWEKTVLVMEENISNLFGFTRMIYSNSERFRTCMLICLARYLVKSD